MATREEHVAAVGEVAAQLRTTAAAGAQALQVHRGTPAEPAVERQLEHTLDRLAALHGRGTYENLSTEQIIESAIDGELRIAAALEGPAAAASTARARSLVDAARRGVRLHVRPPAGQIRIHRGVYVEPLRPDVERLLRQRGQPYLLWRDGAVAVLSERDIDALRSAGDEVFVLFLEPDELYDLDAAGDRPALEAELERRVSAARASADGVGDSEERHLRRLLLHQSTVLRNLRDRLADEHPAAHEALLPVIADHRTALDERLAAAAPAAPPDALGATIDAERRLQTLVTQWTAGHDDPAGARGRLEAVATAGSVLHDLESHHH